MLLTNFIWEQHDGQNYIYKNDIVASTSQNSNEQLVLRFKCEYEDQYIVSSNVSLQHRSQVHSYFVISLFCNGMAVS